MRGRLCGAISRGWMAWYAWPFNSDEKGGARLGKKCNIELVTREATTGRGKLRGFIWRIVWHYREISCLPNIGYIGTMNNHRYLGTDDTHRHREGCMTLLQDKLQPRRDKRRVGVSKHPSPGQGWDPDCSGFNSSDLITRTNRRVWGLRVEPPLARNTPLMNIGLNTRTLHTSYC